MLDLDRVKTNPDIDLSRSHLNYFIENLTAENLNSRVKARIKQLGLKKKPRSEAIGLEDIVVKASAEFMLNADAETREHYFADGRLSAKSLFSPKTLEKLQTDFHRNVSSHYGLERGESQ